MAVDLEALLPPFPEDRYQRALEAEERLKAQIAEYEAREGAIGDDAPEEHDQVLRQVIETPDAIAAKTQRINEEIERLQTVCAYAEALVGIRKVEAGIEISTDSALLEKYIEALKVIHFVEEHPHLAVQREHLLSMANNAKVKVRDSFLENSRVALQQFLDSTKWPNGDFTEEERDKLQTLCSKNFSIYAGDLDLPPVLCVFEVLAGPLRARFAFHFDSKRETNRLDKPEWYLQHVTAIAERHNPFIVDFMQPILDATLPTLNLVASHEFIRALLPMVIAKVQSSSKLILDDTDLLTHLIGEAKLFDDTIREDFGFRTRNMAYWPGTANALLSDEVFAVWLEAEDTFAKERYHEIIDDPEAFEIGEDCDTSGTCEIAPNPASLKLIDKFEAMTRLFSPVENLEQRALFVVTVQLTLLDSFIGKIRASTDAYEQLTSGFSGGFPSVDMAGKEGLQRLCRQLSGVANIHDKLRDWSDETFYIELDPVDGTDACFAQQLQEYSALRTRIEGLVAGHVEKDLIQELRPYSKLNTWKSDEIPARQVASTSLTSPQLIKSYELTTSLFSYLCRVAAPSLVHRIYRKVAHRLDQFLWQSIVVKNQFSRRGALQLKRDVWELWAKFLPFVARPEQGMRKMSDVLVLLSDASDPVERKVLRRAEAATSVSDLRAAGIAELSMHETTTVLASKLFDTTSHGAE